MLGDEEVKSKVIQGSSEPEWDDEFHMAVPDSRYFLRVLLYDRGVFINNQDVYNFTSQ